MRVRLSLVMALAATVLICPGLAAQSTPEELLQTALYKQQMEGDLAGAASILEELVKNHADNRELAARALVHLGQVREIIGSTEAAAAYRRVMRDYPEQQAAVAEARIRLSAIQEQIGVNAPASMAARRVWMNAIDFSGSISPSGRYLSFANWETANLGIRDLATDESRDVTIEGSWKPETYNYAEVSKWSPDGKQLAYTRWIGTAYELRLVDVEGGPSQLLYRHEDVYYPYPGGWSPDGKYISMSLARWDGTSQLALLSVADGSMTVYQSTRVGGAGEGAGQADRFAPDGEYFAYSFSPSNTSNNRDLALMSVDGTENVRLTETDADEDILGWAPDGSLLFKSNRTGRYGLWLLPIEDGQPTGAATLIMADLGNVERLGTSRDGALFYGVRANAVDAFVAPFDPATGQIVGQPERVDPSRLGTTGAAAWSPDGTKLAYRSTRGLDHALMIRTLASRREFELVRVPNIRRIQWHPNGRMVYLNATYEGRSGMYQVELDAPGAALQFVMDEWGQVAPDGRTVFTVETEFSEDRETVEAAALKKIDLESREETVLYEWVPDDIALRFAVSPDGREVVFRSGTGEAPVLQLVSSSGGTPRFLANLEYDGRPVRARFGFEWTPDGRHIVFFGDFWPEAGNDQRLFRVSASGGALEPAGLHTLGPEENPDQVSEMRLPTLNPDGRTIAFMASKDIAPPEVWVLENFLPVASGAGR